MIIACNRCGGLRSTEQFEAFAGTPCKCGVVLITGVRDLIEYAKTEQPDPYEVIRRANEIAAQWNEQKPQVVDGTTIPIYVQHT
jgi:hypothetical protein